MVAYVGDSVQVSQLGIRSASTSLSFEGMVAL